MMDESYLPKEGSRPCHIYQVFLAVFHSIVFCIGLPVHCWAFYRLYRLYKSGSRVPVFLTNLLIPTSLQLLTLPVLTHITVDLENWNRSFRLCVAASCIFCISAFSTVGFLVCVAMEKYLHVAQPAWSQQANTLRFPLSISLGIWGVYVFILGVGVTYPFATSQAAVGYILFSVVTVFFLPLVPLAFFCIGTLRSLAAASAVTRGKRRHTQRTLALIVLVIALVHCPFSLTCMIYFISTLGTYPMILSIEILVPMAVPLDLNLVLCLAVFVRERPREVKDSSNDPRVEETGQD
ncbi:ovarian cancer G-protein coupled receptor 1-like [Lepisosteus oculatus]|uniref:ovarian cancer G-protein coupled receptor 1-like n=1 Tax=Lepisosteus oculatus TaxID=7918 RepID=UPI0037207529